MAATGDGWGARWFGYNNQGLLITETNGYSDVIEKTLVFDIEDRPLWVTDANGVTVTNTYDALGRTRTRTYPDGGVERFGYTAKGLVAYTNQLNLVTLYDYDAAGRKIAETNANLEILRYTNSAAGDLLSLTDGKNQTTRWNYDAYGRVTNKLDQAASVILRYQYDSNDRLTNRWSAAKGNTAYTYDAGGNLTFINYPSSPDVTLTYDALNRVTNMVDAVGTTKYTYTAAGQLLTEDGPFGSDTMTNTYQNRLRVGLSLQQPAGVWTNSFTYDAAKRLIGVTSPAGPFGYLYSAPGLTRHASRLTLANGAYITNTFDSSAWLLGTFLKNSGGTTLNSHEYLYNAGHQRTRQTFTDASTVDYGYDPIGQLTVADSSVSGQDLGYAYDAAWNLNWRTNNGTPIEFQVNVKNELTAVDYDNAIYHDANGNLQTLSENYWTLQYDDENRMISAEYDSETWVEYFQYDGLGRLRKRTMYFWEADPEYEDWYLAGEVRYLYDGMRIIQERYGSNTPKVTYTRGTDLSGTIEGAGGIGGLLAWSAYHYSTRDLTIHACYHADGNGNVTCLSGSNQTVVASYRYDPFGRTISSSGGLAGDNTMRFSSKPAMTLGNYYFTLYRPEFYYYGYRWYYPEFQRWLNRDPIGEQGGVNLYGFVANSPVDRVDFFGLQFMPSHGWPQNPNDSSRESAGDCAERISAEVARTPGRSSDPSSRYQHCLASCRISRECPGGRFTAWIAGDWYQDPWWRHEQQGSDPGDRAANREGRRAACKKKKSCEESCEDALNSGRLYPPAPPPRPPNMPPIIGFPGPVR